MTQRRATGIGASRAARRPARPRSAAGWIEAVKSADVVFTVRMEDGDPALFARRHPRAARRQSARPQAARRPHLRRHAALDRHRLSHARAGGRRSASTSRPTSEMFWDALDLDYAALKPRRPRRRGCSRARETVHITLAQGHRRDARHRRPPARQGCTASQRRRCRSPTCRPARSAWRRSKTRRTAPWSSTSPSGTGARIEDLEIALRGRQGAPGRARQTRASTTSADVLASATAPPT